VTATGRPRDPQVDQAILTAALDVLGECGPGGLTIEAVACRAGVGKATVYRRWDGKEALVLDALATLNEELPEPVGASVRDDLVLLVEGVLDRMTDSVDGLLFARLCGELGEHREAAARYHECVVRPRGQRFRDVVARGTATGELRPDADVEVVLHMLVGGLLHALTKSRLYDRPLPDHLATRVVDTVLAGIRAG
jgi:AcrR family transcriptional regulator